MRRGAWVVLALVGLQVALIGVYLGVEASRAREVPFLSEALDLPAPVVRFERRDGSPRAVDARTVVHFWATWCVPCRTELPSLLAAADSEGVALIAATDEPWPVVERYFDGAVPSAIARDPDGAARAAYAVSGLPDTFVVQDGRVTARVGGPRTWAGASARAFLTGQDAPKRR